MKILHTADWHLGKRLDHISRLEEQQEVLEEICEIADRESVDLVLIAGDLFDNANPSIETIELFYRVLKRLAKDGKRAVVGIAGNHDSPDRIEAPDPLARECGIILSGYPHSRIKPFTLKTGLSVTQSVPGFIELKLPEVAYPFRLILTPYANGFRMKKYLGEENPEAALRELLEAHWKSLADAYFDEKGVNMLMTHLFMMKKGGEHPEEPEDEKPILTVGGAQEIFTQNLPSDLQYVALGHLHRPQKVAETVRYSGSPLSYSMSEAGQEKSVVLIKAEPGKPVSATTIPLTSGRQLVRSAFDNVEKAVEWLTENPNTLVELTISSETYLTAKERKQLFDAHDGIVTLIPRIATQQPGDDDAVPIDLSQDITSLFVDYFRFKHSQEPNNDLMDLFKEVLAEDDEDN